MCTQHCSLHRTFAELCPRALGRLRGGAGAYAHLMACVTAILACTLLQPDAMTWSKREIDPSYLGENVLVHWGLIKREICEALPMVTECHSRLSDTA